MYDDGEFESKIIWSRSDFFYAVTYILDTDIPVMVGYFDSGILSTIMIDKKHEHLIMNFLIIPYFPGVGPSLLSA